MRVAFITPPTDSLGPRDQSWRWHDARTVVDALVAGDGPSRAHRQRPDGGCCRRRLAAGVSAAGGLGMVGMGSAGSTSALHAELPHVSGTFGIGLVDWVIRKEAGLFDNALAAQPALISVSFRTDLSWVSGVHEAGIAAATQVYKAARRRAPKRPASTWWWREAAKAVATGKRRSARCRCWPRSWTPVGAGARRRGHCIAAQPGRSTGRRGQRSMVGTCLSASVEALTATPGAAHGRARETDTESTRVFDIVRRRPWAERFPSRVLRNDFVARWTGHEEAWPTIPTPKRGSSPRSPPTTRGPHRRRGSGRRDGHRRGAGGGGDRQVSARRAHELLAGWGQTART